MPELLPEWTIRAAVLSPDSGLTPSTRLVIIAVAEYCDTRDARPFPSQQRLIADTGLSERTIRTSIREAMQGGWLIRCENPDHYRLMLPARVADQNGGNGSILPATTAALLPTTTEKRKAERRQQEALAYRHAIRNIVAPYYRDSLGKPNFILSVERENLGVNRLRENGGAVSELLYVVDGVRKSDFHMGRERDGREKTRWDLLFRSRDEVEQFTQLARWDGAEPHPYLGSP